MAIVQMQRINICALKKNRKAILERLQELGAMEIDIQLEDDSLGEKQDVASSRALFERRAQTADQALVILNTYVPEKKGMLDSLAGKPLVEKELFEKAAENQDQYMATASRIVTLDKQIAESKAAVLKVQNQVGGTCSMAVTDGSGELYRNSEDCSTDRNHAESTGSAEHLKSAGRCSAGCGSGRCGAYLHRQRFYLFGSDLYETGCRKGRRGTPDRRIFKTVITCAEDSGRV